MINRLKKVLLPVLGTLALAGVIIDFFHATGTRGMSAAEFFSYFTIQSNLLVAIYSFSAMTERKFFFNSAGFFGLALLNITITGMIFFLLLRSTYIPTGVGIYSNLLLHYAVPLLALTVFVALKGRQVFRFLHVFYWLLYAFAYLAYTLVRGSIVDKYPYPFIDITVLGAAQVAINAAGIAAGFLAVALLLVFIDRKFLKQS